MVIAKGLQDAKMLIRNAIVNRLVVSIRYISAEDIETNRDIEPLVSNGIYCYAFCRLRNDFRCFKLSGIVNLIPTQETFELKPVPPNVFDFTNIKPRKVKNGVPPWVWWMMVIIILWWLFQK